jgi:F-type H+-transporting ATPase subunit b
MPINWFTVVAQAINFLILVWLLKRFLYKPILHAIDEREHGIATRLAEAKATQAEAQKERDEFQQKNGAFDQERAALLQKATDEAKSERQRLLDEARKEADSLRAKRQEALRNEQDNLSQEIIRWTQKQVFSIARKALADLADTSLEERMADAFIHQLRALAGAAKEQLAAALRTSTGPAGVRSAIDLSPEQHAAIQKALNETFSADIHIQFETTPELVSGIELTANGQKVAWSISDYLATLEKSAGELLHEETNPEPKPDPKVAAKADPKVATKSDPKGATRSWPKREAKPGLEQVASAPKADR